MKAPQARHEKREGSLVCFLCLLGVLVSAMSLGSMRLYGLYLEHRLADVSRRIEQVGNRNALLEERYSALLSPSRIYNYAKSELKMVTAREVETITLNTTKETGISLAELTPQEAGAVKAPQGLMQWFVGTANAKD
jgi:hypothetical protein